MMIHSIYRATEGEGERIGTPQIFVRLQGCAVGCLNCDSKATWDFSEQSLRPLDLVVKEVCALSRLSYTQRPSEANRALHWVSITGGDPCHPKHVPAVLELTKALKQKGYKINIEASGTRVIHQLFDLLDFISFDVKTPSTGVRTPLKLLQQLEQQYPGRYQVKSVVQDEKDFDYCYKALEHNSFLWGRWILTPSYENLEDAPLQRFEMVMKLNEGLGAPFRVILQQHKWVYGPQSPNT